VQKVGQGLFEIHVCVVFYTVFKKVPETLILSFHIFFAENEIGNAENYF